MPIRSDASGTPGRMWVDYCNDYVIKVYINPSNNTKPDIPNAVATVDLNDFFVGNEVVVGYTAGTWAQADYQDILDWTFIQTPEVCTAP